MRSTKTLSQQRVGGELSRGFTQQSRDLSFSLSRLLHTANKRNSLLFAGRQKDQTVVIHTGVEAKAIERIGTDILMSDQWSINAYLDTMRGQPMALWHDLIEHIMALISSSIVVHWP